MAKGKVSELAGSLATVAIASLGGPLPAVKATLGEVVKHARARYEANAPLRELHRQVEDAVNAWAQGERLPDEVVELGLALATESVARFGLVPADMAALNFDAEKVSDQVLDKARAADRYWGREDHYGVAERGVRSAYGVMMRQFQASEPILLPAIQALRAGLDNALSRVEAQGARAEATLTELAAVLVEAATVAEVMAYVRARISDWDRSPWHADQAPSFLERRLRVRERARDHRSLAARSRPGRRWPGSGCWWCSAARDRARPGWPAATPERPPRPRWSNWMSGPGWTRWRCRCSPPGTGGSTRQARRESPWWTPHSPPAWDTAPPTRVVSPGCGGPSSHRVGGC